MKQIVDGPVETEVESDAEEEQEFMKTSVNSEMNFEEVDLHQDVEVQRMMREYADKNSSRFDGLQSNIIDTLYSTHASQSRPSLESRLSHQRCRGVSDYLQR